MGRAGLRLGACREALFEPGKARVVVPVAALDRPGARLRVPVVAIGAADDREGGGDVAVSVVVDIPHEIAVELSYQGQGYGAFSYLKGYTFRSASNHSFGVGAPTSGGSAPKFRGGLMAADAQRGRPSMLRVVPVV